MFDEPAERDAWNITSIGAFFPDIERLRAFVHKGEEDWLRAEAAQSIYDHLADAEEFAKNGKIYEARQSIDVANEAYTEAYARFQRVNDPLERPIHLARRGR